MLGPDEAAIRITNPERFGVICDLIRPADSYVRAAAQAGLRLRKQSPIVAAPWHPRYSTHGRQALFHLLEFAKVSVS